MAENIDNIDPGVPDTVWYGVPDGPNGSVRSSEIDQVADHKLRMMLELQLDDQLEGSRYLTIPMTNDAGEVYRVLTVRRLPLQLMDPE